MKEKGQNILLRKFSSYKRSIVGFYYRNVFYFFKTLRIQELIILNYSLIASFLVVIITFYFFWYPNDLYVALPSLSTEIYIVESALRTISIFISIVFSFVVLSFNVFYKYFGRFTFTQFFSSPYIKFIFTLFISAIALQLYTIGYLKEISERDKYGDSLYIMSLGTSIFLVLAIIPTLVLLLRSSQNRNNIRLVINQANKDWRLSYLINVEWDRSKKHAHLHRDPIALLYEIGTAAIKDFDRASLKEIQEGCISHLKKMHSDYKVNQEVHPFEFYDEIIKLCRSLFPVAIKERNETAALIIIRLFSDTELFYLDNFDDFNINELDEHHYDGILFKVVMEEFLSRALQFNEDYVCDQIIQHIQSWWGKYIKQYLPKIKYNYPAKERFALDKTSLNISTISSQLRDIFALIFVYKKPHLYSKVASFYKVTNSEISDSANTRDTKVYLFQILGLSNEELFKQYLSEKNSDLSYSDYPYSYTSSIELSSVGSGIPFQYELRIIGHLFRIGRLNGFVINSIKATIYHLIIKFTEINSSKKVLIQAINKFDIIRGYIAKDASDEKKEVYILLERYLGYVKEWILEYKVTDEDVITLVDETLSKFTFKGEFTKHFDDTGYEVKDVR